LTSDWIKLHGQHESGTEQFILDHLKPQSTFLDIGANIGYFSLLAAITAKAKAVAFEPQQQIADLLVQSAIYNGVQDSIKVEKVALSNTPATMKMSFSPGNTGHSQLVEADSSDAQSYLVPVVPLDEWMTHNPLGTVSVCKIDVEGVDLQVLEGMSKLLSRDQPALVIELIDENLAAFGSSHSTLFDFLKVHGYVDVSSRYTFRGDSNGYFVKG
ncbi:MAG TPA: FkbM family methyltransferase, partial [Opitutaceae bacterium]